MAAVSFPDIFGGWLQGRRSAEADNWRDLNQYNQVLSGQLKNAYDMATFDPRVRQSWIGADKSLVDVLTGAATADDTMAQLDAAQRYDLANQQAAAKSLGYQQYMQYTPQINDLNYLNALLRYRAWFDWINAGGSPAGMGSGQQQPSSVNAPGAETYPGSPYEVK